MSDREAAEPSGRVFRWYLESFVEGGRQLRRIALHPLPFRVGRLPGLALSLRSDSVSKEHAEFELRGGELHVRDLGSKNGTFVNSERIRDAVLREGDILHFAQLEYRLGRQEIGSSDEQALEPATRSLRDMPSTAGLSFGDAVLPRQFVEGARQLPDLLRERQVTAVFQPIVSLPSQALAGLEALGRGRHPGLPAAPLELFRIAASIGAEAELSEVFCQKALEIVDGRANFPPLFLNIHPAELKSPALVPSIVAACHRAPQLRLTLEVSEGALADRESVDRLRTQLSRAGVRLAYDDFGAGQARLLELAEVPPDFLKFDMSFVRGVNEASKERQRLLTSLVSVARDLLVWTVAEGVETPEEADACMHIGFTHAQGFYFGRPCPIEEIRVG
jgi:EAL domain-containing protein (putative c-di-GMP-specific phosphodiesterase class I)